MVLWQNGPTSRQMRLKLKVTKLIFQIQNIFQQIGEIRRRTTSKADLDRVAFLESSLKEFREYFLQVLFQKR
jgi:hypothetical protein